MLTITGTANETATAKIRRVLPERLIRRLDAVLGSLAFTAPPAETAAPESTVLLSVADAIRYHRPISIRYTAGDGRRSARTLHPYGLVVHGFWHEAYFMRGGVDAIYADMAKPTGLARFAPATPARGAMFSARHRAGRHEETLSAAPVIAEQAYYDPPATMGKDPSALVPPDGTLAPDQPVQSEQHR